MKLKMEHQKRKRNLQRLIRYRKHQENFKRDSLLNSVCSKNPSPTYRFLKGIRSAKVEKIQKLYVDSDSYEGLMVPDGIFESIRRLKNEPVSLTNDPTFPDFTDEYHYILEICQSGKKIPPLSIQKSTQILNSLKKNVNDFFSISALHFIHAGDVGLEHFHFLLNAIIENVNLSGLRELNTVYASILYKGHGKDRTQSRSYRTISMCPILSKALDIYVKELSSGAWMDVQAPTQFQGQGMSHEIASLLLTETILYSRHTSKKPLFALFLDAKSAFDRVVKEILVRNLFFSGTDDQRLIYLDQRLSNRTTYCDFDDQLMGPILDTRGLEQGGILSSEAYKLYNNEQAITAQRSGLGASLGFTMVSCISLADDAVLVSNDIHDLKNLLHLTTQYCKKYDVKLVPEKTILLAYGAPQHEAEFIDHAGIISLDGMNIRLSQEAVHLGVVRTIEPSNNSAITDRISAYKRQLYSLLPSGIALNHHGSPAASLRVHTLYCLPVLLSGLPSLVLSKSEVKILSTCFKTNLQRLMKLPEKTPDPAIYFLAGSLPLNAIFHLRQLSLFSMICHMQNNVLKDHAIRTLTNKKDKSWFHVLRSICVQYDLPHPLNLLYSPPVKSNFKSLCKSKVHDYWHRKLSHDAQRLPSLCFMDPRYLSLSSPHPLWCSLDGNSYQSEAAFIQALFLSGRYRTEMLCRFWSQNVHGFCLICLNSNLKIAGTMEHIFLQCDGLTGE